MPENKTRGRTTKLTPQLQDEILSFIRKGSFLQDAARGCGLSRVTINRWLKRGREEKRGAYHEFAKEFDSIETKVLNVALQSILAAGTVGLKEEKTIVESKRGKVVSQTSVTVRKQDWRASAYFLEKRYPKRFGNRVAMEVTGKNGGPIELRAVQSLTDAELEALVAEGQAGKGRKELE